MNHRREIDGLRALAVVPVILFHAGFQHFGGGFVGVDVFFVISGYLITSLILEQQATGSFSLAEFYERRARRILPALFVVMAACLPLAWFWLLPGDLSDFGRSLAAVSVFASNLHFWRGSGYFDTAAEFEPLLHTWSLAVEEQYYLVFPLLMLALARVGRRVRVATLAVVALASLALAQWAVLNRPAAGFFLLPTRAWELLLGALVSFALHRGPAPARAPAWHGGAALVGLALIAGSVFTFDSGTPFPGLHALVPTVGTALVIAFATPGNVVGRILSSRALVGIGLISYSAYLWHQPLLAFARQRNWSEPGPPLLIALCVATFGLAWLSWRFVEEPVRRGARFGRGTVLAGALVGTAGFATIGATLALGDGAPQRFTGEQRAVLALGRTAYTDTMRIFGLGSCFVDYHQDVETLLRERCVPEPTAAGRLLVVGDSEAAHLMSGIRTHFGAAGLSIGQWTGAGCAPIEHAGNTPRCRGIQGAFARVVLPTITAGDVVILSSDWLGLYRRNGPVRFARALDATLASLGATGAAVIVVGDTPEFFQPPHHALVKRGGAIAPDASVRSEDFRASTDAVRMAAARAGAGFFAPAGELCRHDQPLVCAVRADGEFLFFDAKHLSGRGSDRVVGALRDALRRERVVGRLAPAPERS